MIVREGLARHAAARAPPRCSRRPSPTSTRPAPRHISRLLDGAGPQAALDWWAAYLDLLVPPVLAAYFDHGLVLEPHLQNVLICVDGDGMPAQVLFRDLEGTKLVPEHHADTLAALPAEVAGPMTYDAQRGWDRVVYCLLVNHVAELLAALADLHPEHRGRAVGAGPRARSGRTPTGTAARRGCAALLAGVPLPAKANLLTRWERKADREAGYVRLPSPLAEDVLRRRATDDRPERPMTLPTPAVRDRAARPSPPPNCPPTSTTWRPCATTRPPYGPRCPSASSCTTRPRPTRSRRSWPRSRPYVDGYEVSSGGELAHVAKAVPGPAAGLRRPGQDPGRDRGRAGTRRASASTWRASTSCACSPSWPRVSRPDAPVRGAAARQPRRWPTARWRAAPWPWAAGRRPFGLDPAEADDGAPAAHRRHATRSCDCAASTPTWPAASTRPEQLAVAESDRDWAASWPRVTASGSPR